MIKSIYKKIFFVFLIAWAVIWVNFLVRDLTKGKQFKEYKVLLSRDDAGKRSWTYGDRLFEFLRFAEKSLPFNVSYNLAGVDEAAVDYRRAIYYLSPRLKTDNAEYVLVFDKPGYMQDGYVMYRELDPSRFILKKI
ncbi:MAG: hypothetical protein WCY36_04380 [Candidatus Omnitrophota bacterium]